MQKPRSWILTHPEAVLTDDQIATLTEKINDLDKSLPLPYLIGHWEFYGLGFSITPDVLIPRPETETLVERALTWLEEHPERRWGIDIGTGSGCIAISLTVNVPDLHLIACDISPPALKIALDNAKHHNVTERISFVQSDLLLSIHTQKGKRFDLICANLPYIPTETLNRIVVGKQEPFLALNGGADGLDLISRLLESSVHQLSPGGICLIEIEASLGVKAKSLAESYFPQAQVRIIPDLAGRHRLLEIQIPKV
jgi:release factor glutamine methyltransferase